MKSRAIAAVLWSIATTATAAEGPPQPEPLSLALAWLVLLLPCLGMVLLIVLVRSRRSATGYMDRANRHIDRDAEHMARMEAKADRMIALLESIDRRLGA